MDFLVQRQALAEWRDRHIIDSAALVNLRATEARRAFEEDLGGAEFRGPLLNAQRIAASRIDAHMREALAADLELFRSTAAAELAALDKRLDALAEGLRSSSLDLFEGQPELPDREPPAAEASGAASDSAAAPPPGGPWFKRLPGAAADKAARAVEDVQSAAATTLFETSGGAERMRKAAGRRLEQAWTGETDNPPTLLSRMILLIDQTAHAARMALS